MACKFKSWEPNAGHVTRKIGHVYFIKFSVTQKIVEKSDFLQIKVWNWNYIAYYSLCEILRKIG